MKRIILAAAVISLFCSGLVYSDIRNFSITTNSVYSPGQKVSMDVYSYNYDANDRRGKDLRAVFTVYKITDLEKFFSAQSSVYVLDLISKDTTSLINTVSRVYGFTRTLKPKNEYGYSSINESIDLNVSDKGAYLVKAVSENSIAYCGFFITELGLISKAGSNSIAGFVANRESGKSVSDSRMVFYLGSKKVGESLTQNGSAKSEFSWQDVPANDRDIRPLVFAYSGSDVAVSDQYFFFGYNESRYETYMFTEQPVYRAGATVNFKGIVRSRTSTGFDNVPDKILTVSVKDNRGSDIYKEQKTTNVNGSFDGSVTLSEEAETGEYSIEASFEGGATAYAQFTVEQYKKPEYKVTVTPSRSQYYGDEILEAKIKADYFFGSPVTDADVEYEIHKVRYYRPWWIFSDYADWYRDYYGEDEYSTYGSEMVYKGEGKIGSDGELDITYKLNEEFKEQNEYDWFRPYFTNSDYRYIITARVTDKARHSVSGSSDVFVTRGGFYLSARSGSYIYKPGDAVTIFVNVANFANEPVSAEFNVYIYKYSSGYYGDGSKDLVTVVKGNTGVNGAGSVVYQSSVSGGEGSYLAEVKAIDSRAKEITASAYFYVASETYSWYNYGGDIQIITDKESYEEGEICRAVVVAPVSDIDIFITTETADIVYDAVKQLNGTSVSLEIPVTDKYVSGFALTASYMYKGTNHSTSNRVIVIPKKRILTVLIEPSQLIYEPKEEGQLRVRVVDSYGVPVSNAEVSIGIVDESIYSIKPDKTKSIDRFFYGSPRVSVSTGYNSGRTITGNSRLMTILEKFFMNGSKDFGTVRGLIRDMNGQPLSGVPVMIDDEYYAALTGEDGRFEFRLPEGRYRIGLLGFEGIVASKRISVEEDESTDYSSSVDGDKIVRNIPDNGGMLSEQDEFRGGRDEVMQDATSIQPTEANVRAYKMSAPEEGSYVEAEVRSDFRDAIFWTPFAVTDSEGYVTLNVKYPDNLTTWRITSRVITGDTKVGQSVKTVITRKDLLVRLEAPRFIRENDEVTISAIVHNYLTSQKSVKLMFKTENAELVSGNTNSEFVVAPDSERRMDIVVKASDPTGEAVLYAEALTNEESDAMEIRVPVEPTGLKLQKNLAMDFDEPVKTETATIEIPQGMDIRKAKLMLSMDPSLASAILTSLDDLVGYPYGCVEQTMSRFLPTVVVAQAFQELNAPLSEATRSELPKMVNKGLSRLYSLQHSNGGWGWWRNDENNAFMTAYVVYGLSIAGEAGYAVDQSSLSRGIGALRLLVKSNDIDQTTKAYALYSLAVADEQGRDFVKTELNSIDDAELNNYGRSLVALAWKKIGEEKNAMNVVAQLKKNVVRLDGEGGAYWEGKSFRYNWQDDKVQTTAMALKALVSVGESLDLKDLVIRWLILQRQGTSWRSTQETAMIIYSMIDYLKTSNELDPDYSLNVSVNGKEVYSDQFTRSDVFNKSRNIEIGPEQLNAGANSITIEKNGRGKVYFTSALTYYKPLDMVIADEGGYRVEKEIFELEEYKEYGGDRITYKTRMFDGTVTSGDVILVKLRVHTKQDENNYFMLEDAFPSGSEYVKDDWAYSIEGESDYSRPDRYYWRWWYADRDVRDDRIVFFATSMGKGVYEFSYLLRAEIPGEYSINPAVGSLMYFPEVYGNTAGSKITILDK